MATAFSSIPICILRVGNIGLLFAHHLAECHSVGLVNLPFHRYSLIQECDEADRKIELVSNKIYKAHKGYGFQFLQPQNGHANSVNNLIIATKATNSIGALKILSLHLA